MTKAALMDCKFYVTVFYMNGCIFYACFYQKCRMNTITPAKFLPHIRTSRVYIWINRINKYASGKRTAVSEHDNTLLFWILALYSSDT
jgi:hypothetical protein